MLLAHVCVQAALVREGFPAVGHLALVRLLPCVDPHVSLQSSFLCKALLAARNSALVRVKAIMLINVGQKRVLAVVRAIASRPRALEFPLLHVDLLVVLQVPRSREGLRATRMIALEGSISLLKIKSCNGAQKRVRLSHEKIKSTGQKKITLKVRKEYFWNKVIDTENIQTLVILCPKEFGMSKHHKDIVARRVNTYLLDERYG